MPSHRSQRVIVGSRCSLAIRRVVERATLQRRKRPQRLTDLRWSVSWSLSLRPVSTREHWQSALSCYAVESLNHIGSAVASFVDAFSLGGRGYDNSGRECWRPRCSFGFAPTVGAVSADPRRRCRRRNGAGVLRSFLKLLFAASFSAKLGENRHDRAGTCVYLIAGQDETSFPCPLAELS